LLTAPIPLDAPVTRTVFPTSRDALKIDMLFGGDKEEMLGRFTGAGNTGSCLAGCTTRIVMGSNV